MKPPIRLTRSRLDRRPVAACSPLQQNPISATTAQHGEFFARIIKRDEFRCVIKFDDSTRIEKISHGPANDPFLGPGKSSPGTRVD
jgi:hypothetical protein